MFKKIVPTMEKLLQLEYAFKCVERVVMAPIHGLAFFPNGEADMYRDE